MIIKTTKNLILATTILLITASIFANTHADVSSRRILIETPPELITEAEFLQGIIDNHMWQRAPQVLEQVVARNITFKIVPWTPAYRDINVLVDFAKRDEMIFVDRYLREARVQRKYTHYHIMRTIGHELQHFIQFDAGMYRRVLNLTEQNLFQFMRDAAALGVSYNEPVYSDAVLREILSDMQRRAGNSSACEIAYAFLEIDADAKGRIFLEPEKYNTTARRNSELRARYRAFGDRNRFNNYLEWAREGTCRGR